MTGGINSMILYSLSCILLQLGNTVYGAERDSSTRGVSSIKALPVPAIGYTPETGFYLGVFSLFTLNLYRDTLTRASNVKAEFDYTWKKQMIFESSWNYFFKREKWYTQGQLHYSKFVDLYFGIGESTAGSSETRYQVNRLIANVNLLKKIGDRLFVGPKVVFKDYSKLKYFTSIQYPELTNAKTLGLGFTVLKDTRNNLLNASQGIYLEFTNVYNFLDSRYSKTIIDGRTYKTVIAKTVGSIRFYNEFTAGNPLFYDYALIGSDKIVRGYYYGRFRDKNLSSLQGEVRRTLVGRFGAAVFGGITKVYPDLRSFTLTNLKPNYGLGLRFLIDRKNNINLRLDYGFGQGDDGFYVMFGESF